MMRFEGKVVLVTGGSQGIGRRVAELVGAEGAAVAVVASGSRDKAAAVAGGIARATAHAADVRRPEQVRALVSDVLAAHGRIDCFVNAAGVFFPTPAGTTAGEEVDRIVDINLKGAFHAINAVVPEMRAGGGGRIVSVASVAGVMGIAGYSLYCATKAGIVMMTRALAVELAREGIRVNAVAPGNTATPMNEDIRTDPAFAPMLDAMTARTPTGRTYSDPDDIANAVLFLLSDEARAFHGATLLADEGYSAGM